ncbi:MAG TPA: hypothetical protein QGG47_13360 [Acidobacteriota bacterium]|nr:hypothetical protein [Acidobacteriota bacterium]
MMARKRSGRPTKEQAPEHFPRRIEFAANPERILAGDFRADETTTATCVGADGSVYTFRVRLADARRMIADGADLSLGGYRVPAGKLPDVLDAAVHDGREVAPIRIARDKARQTVAARQGELREAVLAAWERPNVNRTANAAATSLINCDDERWGDEITTEVEHQRAIDALRKRISRAFKKAPARE